ncbi:hypothetical protein TNIN_48741 [Trichonephila inaurata madagascariensis]|uniref:Uncharacterized protein n=1 Tax=Trichonephila inaurata madagascariensis TaxID=2747483 RepID=A0A8X6XTE8_9ARAC|nr:hypothetical protein TNIN_48741 [Trichonephila inaurata madagascariensis]
MGGRNTATEFRFSSKTTISLLLNQLGFLTMKRAGGEPENHKTDVFFVFASWRRGYLSGIVQMWMTPDRKVAERVRALSPFKVLFRLV